MNISHPHIYIFVSSCEIKCQPVNITYTTVQKFGSVIFFMFLKEVSYARQSWNLYETCIKANLYEKYSYIVKYYYNLK